jgi:hypothetical protein
MSADQEVGRDLQTGSHHAQVRLGRGVERPARAGLIPVDYHEELLQFDQRVPRRRQLAAAMGLGQKERGGVVRLPAIARIMAPVDCLNLNIQTTSTRLATVSSTQIEAGTAVVKGSNASGTAASKIAATSSAINTPILSFRTRRCTSYRK